MRTARPPALASRRRAAQFVVQTRITARSSHLDGHVALPAATVTVLLHRDHLRVRTSRVVRHEHVAAAAAIRARNQFDLPHSRASSDTAATDAISTVPIAVAYSPITEGKERYDTLRPTPRRSEPRCGRCGYETVRIAARRMRSSPVQTALTNSMTLRRGTYSLSLQCVHERSANPRRGTGNLQ